MRHGGSEVDTGIIPRRYVEVGSTGSVLVSSLRGEGEKSLFLHRNFSSFYITLRCHYHCRSNKARKVVETVI